MIRLTVIAVAGTLMLLPAAASACDAGSAKATATDLSAAKKKKTVKVAAKKKEKVEYMRAVPVQ
jgi:hypothetical protein